MGWLIIAILLLLSMKESMEINQSQDKSKNLSIKDLILLPYLGALRSNRTEERNESGAMTNAEQLQIENDLSGGVASNHQQNLAPPATSSPSAVEPYEISVTDESASDNNANYVTIQIKMPTSDGFRSWASYDVIIETGAVAIYLYATFVLTSTLFLNAEKAMGYVMVMMVCLRGVKILCTWF